MKAFGKHTAQGFRIHRSRMETFLLCRPDYFKIEYSINPWMVADPVNPDIAKMQWDSLKATIETMGAKVKVIEPVKGLPDMTFAANAGIVHKDKFVLSSMKYKERQKESSPYRTWFEKMGYQIIEMIPNISFEGCGDTLIYRDSIIGGYGYRSDLLALELTAGALGLGLYDLKLRDPMFYHLDTCFCKVSDTTAIYYPGAFHSGEIEKLRGVIDLVPVSEQDARLFMCNSMLVNDTLLIPSNNSEIDKKLRNSYGVKTCVVDVSEFLKSGGSIQCLSLKI
jgi:N-dimethylarginine dimethylaminohydrolase